MRCGAWLWGDGGKYGGAVCFASTLRVRPLFHTSHTSTFHLCLTLALTLSPSLSHSHSFALTLSLLHTDDDLKFDMETAFKVLRSAGYAAHALSVAERAGQPEWILDVLLEDMGSYAEAVTFIGE